MKASEWLSAPARAAITKRVRAIEARTSAEVVVTVRARSATYRHVDLAVGAAVAFVALAVYVYAPIDFTDDPAPPAIAMCFAIGALLTSLVAPWKRLFVSRPARLAAVRQAARAAFVDQGIARTSARSGILVYVSLFEREVDVIADACVEVGTMGESWSKAVAELEAAVRSGSSLESVGDRLHALGDALAAAMPRQDDDDNELPDGASA
jgi:putative membrane protein